MAGCGSSQSGKVYVNRGVAIDSMITWCEFAGGKKPMWLVQICHYYIRVKQTIVKE